MNHKDKEEKESKPKIIKDKKGNSVGISIDAKRREKPKNLDEAFANVFSNFM